MQRREPRSIRPIQLGLRRSRASACFRERRLSPPRFDGARADRPSRVRGLRPPAAPLLTSARTRRPLTGCGHTAVVRRVIVGSLAIAVVVGSMWAAKTLWEIQRREAAIDRLLSLVTVAPNGAEIDFASAFDLVWDRAIVVPPYSPGSVANAILGFDRYPADDVITNGDGAELLVFARDRDVVAEVPNDGYLFDFGDSVESFTPHDARFRLERDDVGGGAILAPLD